MYIMNNYFMFMMISGRQCKQTSAIWPLIIGHYQSKFPVSSKHLYFYLIIWWRNTLQIWNIISKKFEYLLTNWLKRKATYDWLVSFMNNLSWHQSYYSINNMCIIFKKTCNNLWNIFLKKNIPYKWFYYFIILLQL